MARKIRPTCGKADCKYETAAGTQLICEYMLITGHKRPCKATPGCKCYEKMSSKKRGSMYTVKVGR